MNKLLLGFCLLVSVTSFAQSSVQIELISEFAKEKGKTHHLEIKGPDAQKIFDLLTEYYPDYDGNITYRVGSVDRTEKKGDNIYCKSDMTIRGYEGEGKKEFSCLVFSESKLNTPFT